MSEYLPITFHFDSELGQNPQWGEFVKLFHAERDGYVKNKEICKQREHVVEEISVQESDLDVSQTFSSSPYKTALEKSSD